MTRALTRTLSAALLLAAWTTAAVAGHLEPVGGTQMPQFSGPCGTATAGTATFNCNGLLAGNQTIGGAWNFQGITALATNANSQTTPASSTKGGVQYIWNFSGGQMELDEVPLYPGAVITKTLYGLTSQGVMQKLGQWTLAGDTSYGITTFATGAAANSQTIPPSSTTGGETHQWNYTGGQTEADEFTIYPGAAIAKVLYALNSQSQPVPLMQWALTGNLSLVPLSVPAPAVSQNDNTADSTANSQNRLSHVANNAALAAWTNTAFPVERDGFAVAGDGGRAKYTWSATACAAADGGTQVTATTGGCWLLDYSSMQFEITPQLFGATFRGTATSAADTTATQSALATGKTVHLSLNGGSFYPNNCLTIKTPGQYIYGDGAYTNAVLNVGTGLTTANAPSGCIGIFQVPTAGLAPGPKIRDIGVQFAQPTAPANAAALNVYPPAFYFRAAPGFIIAHSSCFFASTCVDMQGNSGGSTITDFLASAFNYGIQIDGSLNVVQILGYQWFPYGMTAQQSALFTANSTQAISMGRMDDFIIDQSLFYGGTGVTTFTSTASATNGNNGGPAFGTISNTDFDSYSGIAAGSGTITCANCIFSQAVAGVIGVNVYGGDVHVVGGNINSAAALTNASMLVQSGNLSISESTIQTLGSVDMISVSQTGGTLQLGTGVRFIRPTGTAYTKPVVSLTGGRTQISFPYINDKGAGAGTFISVQNDNAYNKIIGSSAPGWTYSFPSSPTAGAQYLYNN